MTILKRVADVLATSSAAVAKAIVTATMTATIIAATMLATMISPGTASAQPEPEPEPVADAPSTAAPPPGDEGSPAPPRIEPPIAPNAEPPNGQPAEEDEGLSTHPPELQNPPMQPEPSPPCVGEDCPGAAARVLDASDARLIELGLKTDRASTPSHFSEIGWGLAALPGDMLETVFLPVRHLVSVTERYHLIDRVGAFFKISDRISARPKTKIATGFGVGLGASLTYDWGEVAQREISVGGLYNLNTDYELDVSIGQSFASIEGRRIVLEVERSIDQGEKYFGIGGTTELADERELGIDTNQVTLEGELAGRGLEAFSGIGTIGLLHERLYAGTGSQPPVGEAMDSVAVPPGFDETTAYLNLGLDFRYDRRDTLGRTSKGTVTEIGLGFTSDLQGRDRTAFTGSFAGRIFIPILGRERTLVMSAGAGWSEAVFAEHTVPLHALVTLGRKNHLRGYTSERFRSTRGWWSSLEYRYPIWYFDEKPATLSTVVFADIGGSGNTFGELVDRSPHYSYGVGISLEAYALALASFQFGRSPEGNEFIFGAGIDI